LQRHPFIRMHRSILLVALLSVTFGIRAQIKLSPEAHISVITCGPWQGELYSAFGHNAIRVYDPEQRINEAYNYGVFDFNQPHFYLNFARGYLYYKLGVWDYPGFAKMYIYENRFVHEQVLNLTARQKQKVYDFLQWNALPENQYYRYDYFYDNCASRIRDVFVNVLKDSVAFDGSYIHTEYTIRDLTDLYLGHQPWGDLGIDICLGLPMDKVVSPYEYMFLPDYIESGFDHAYIYHGRERLPLVARTINVYESRDEDPPKGLPHPLLVFGLLAILVVVLSIYDIGRKKLSTWFDALLFGLAGMIGLLLICLWFFTDHKAAAKNFNLLWALPTHLFAVVTIGRTQNWTRLYFLITAIISILLLFFWQILPQALNYSLIPVVIALGTRAFTQFWIRGAFPGNKS
jgi:Domain of unknown function (DUF4105)